jgi:hypothetical protein
VTAQGDVKEAMAKKTRAAAIMPPMSDLERAPEAESRPPIFGTWRGFYIVVVANTLLVYLLLLLFSRYAR